jgi:hypothetical protein
MIKTIQTATASPAPPVRNLRDEMTDLQRRLESAAVSSVDMSRSGALELAIGSGPLDNPYRLPDVWPLRLERIEGPIMARQVLPAAPGASRFTHFLDGSQRTFPVWRIGLVPIVVALTAAGTLQRNARGDGTVVSGALRMERHWIFPTRSGLPELGTLIEMIGNDDAIVDPLIDRKGEPVEHYHQLAGHYGKLLMASQEQAGRIRARIERDLLMEWVSGAPERSPDDWLVVDGRLHDNVPNAVGLVKDLQTQHLVGDEARALFDLPQGCRTTAFRYVRNTEDDRQPESQGRTMWYMRFWDAAGLDARHSLVRIEAAHDVSTTEEIDEISGWLLAERIPRATNDPRWPTLLYPIHLLESILKRRLASISAGWPS